jgi:hypothetical protein
VAPVIKQFPGTLHNPFEFSLIEKVESILNVTLMFLSATLYLCVLGIDCFFQAHEPINFAEIAAEPRFFAI